MVCPVEIWTDSDDSGTCPHDQLLAALHVPVAKDEFNKQLQAVETVVVALAGLVPHVVVQVAENKPACVTIMLVPVLGVGLVFQVIVPPAHPLAVNVTLVAGKQSDTVPVGEIVGAEGVVPILFVTTTLAEAVQAFVPVAVTIYVPADEIVTDAVFAVNPPVPIHE
jgi:hypothetical protein